MTVTDFFNQRIKALEDANRELREQNDELKCYIFELCMDECPDDYKRVVLHETYYKSNTHTT
jgi:hypothetical protein